MSDEEQEILTGRIGTEASQGYSQMPGPAEQPDELDTESPSYKHLTRPEDPVFDLEREYHDPATGKPRDKYEAVPLERASRDLADARRQERAEREAALDIEMRTALDGLPQQTSEQQPSQNPQPQPDEQPQPEGTDQAQAATQDGESPDPWAQAERQIGEMLKDPVVRERIEAEYSHVVQQANAVAEQAKQQAAAVINNLAQEANLVASAIFPELAGLSPEQVQGALRVMKPERVAQVREFANKIQGIANVAQQQAFAQQQAQQQQAELQQRQAAEAFQRYAAEQDAKALAKETPESLAQIRNVLYEDGKKAGYSKADIDQAWNTIPALRNAYVSELIADGAKWRMSQRALATHRANPIPKVQRPGVASDGPSDNNEYASLERSLRGKDLNPKQAADLLIAHRARR